MKLSKSQNKVLGMMSKGAELVHLVHIRFYEGSSYWVGGLENRVHPATFYALRQRNLIKCTREHIGGGGGDYRISAAGHKALSEEK